MLPPPVNAPPAVMPAFMACSSASEASDGWKHSRQQRPYMALHATQPPNDQAPSQTIVKNVANERFPDATASVTSFATVISPAAHAINHTAKNT
eukprot:CAMPEP_0182548296 /NCGR_PEP_ID=MMETSP1323-20130603/38629_1 /TAXON_ID=236787 /ORGANISM="Florenciella parvula, Strain RCC1693" /LENGTH=93 /DNA_ID=CAMNT_0024759681 /DNA_START=261 /DNA_END=539 /DNA_ORIENTATION=+